MQLQVATLIACVRLHSQSLESDFGVHQYMLAKRVLETWLPQGVLLARLLSLAGCLAISQMLVPDLEGTLVTERMQVEDQRTLLPPLERQPKDHVFMLVRSYIVGFPSVAVLLHCQFSEAQFWSPPYDVAITGHHKALQRGSSVSVLESGCHICVKHVGHVSSYQSLSFVAIESTRVRFQMCLLESQFDH